jgi:hypothetical protein
MCKSTVNYHLIQSTYTVEILHVLEFVLISAHGIVKTAYKSDGKVQIKSQTRQ